MIINLIIIAVLGFLIYTLFRNSSGYADYMGAPSDQSLVDDSDTPEESGDSQSQDSDEDAPADDQAAESDDES